MNRALARIIIALFGAVAFTGCGPAGPKAPVPVKRDEATIMREWLYGPRATAPGVMWQPSGLGIRMITPGTGESPKTTDRVRVHYVCSIKDGTVVDDSRKRGAPADLVVNTLIAGWAEGMAALKPGGRADFFIPPSLGYGTMGGGGVPAGAGLFFDVELIAVNPMSAAKE
jgi:FKBP-type peptidyl-prolyl cis-trans isomerase FklB